MRMHRFTVSMLMFLVVGGTGCMRLDLSDILGPRSLRGVSPDAWAQLKVGMSKQEVIALLGDSQSKIGPMKSEKGLVLKPEYWEYGWTDGLSLSGPSPKAHAVFFGDDGRVISFRGPRDDRGEYDYEDIGNLRIGGDYLESIPSRQEGPKSPTLKPPIPQEPANRSVFHHFPREIVLRWAPASDTPADVQYFVQEDFTSKGDYASFGEWDEEEPLFTYRTGKCTMNDRHCGAQPGRWRVKVFNESGESEWSEWQYFRFTR